MRFTFVFALMAIASTSYAADYKPVVLDSNYDHTKYSPICSGYEKEFRAYTTCFDTKADDGEAWQIPDFFSYNIKRYEGTLPSGPGRPRPWITEKICKTVTRSQPMLLTLTLGTSGPTILTGT